jgi:hypothetical protein
VEAVVANPCRGYDFLADNQNYPMKLHSSTSGVLIASLKVESMLVCFMSPDNKWSTRRFKLFS